jgi:hypothetical protein
MKNLVLGAAVLMVFLCAAVIPASAAVAGAVEKSAIEMSDTHLSELQISPDPADTAICDATYDSVITTWMKGSEIWKEMTELKISGPCVDYLTSQPVATFECNSKYVDNMQNNDGEPRTSIANGDCVFVYPDGSTATNLFHSTYANGEWKVDSFEWI